MPVVEPSRRILVVGAGPCGLACGRELDRLGHRDWLLVERSPIPGGLAASVRDSAGFTWDLGGHVVFSHFGEFDALLAEVMGGEIWQHDRSSYVRFGDRWVPYPFQNNLRHLPPEVTYDCLLGLIAAGRADLNGDLDFATWMQTVFGDGITRHFMAPYNFKVWATPAERMAADWIAERVSVVDYRRALENVVLGRDDVAWGPNNRFVFPASGGTGEIYRRLAAKLAEHVEYSRELVEIDPLAKVARFHDGSDERYDALVSTMPLDLLVGAVTDCPDAVRDAARALEHNSVYMVGVGYAAPLQDEKSWMYFPSPSIPFYRATNFAKYSPANVPDEDTERYCSYMTETSYSGYKPEPRSGIEERVTKGLRSAGVIDERAPVASVRVEDIPYAYPIPTLGRDRALAVIQSWLMERRIYSRGRFGAWRYETGNMDHAVKMGIDVSRLLVRGEPEGLWVG
jgi:UDP-galactopyranose mutase